MRLYLPTLETVRGDSAARLGIGGGSRGLYHSLPLTTSIVTTPDMPGRLRSLVHQGKGSRLGYPGHEGEGRHSVGSSSLRGEESLGSLETDHRSLL